MTPVAMATATACVKFMQLNLWRAVSRYPFTLANDRFSSPAMSDMSCLAPPRSDILLSFRQFDGLWRQFEIDGHGSVDQDSHWL
jgi:hypothetical protein